MTELLSNDFKIKFDGEKHQIDANVLINNLIHISNIIQELNRNLDSGKHIDIVIKSLDKGSFLVHVELMETVVESIKNIFTSENVFYSSALIAGLVGVIDLAKFLKKDKNPTITEIGDKVKLKDSSGNTIIVGSNIYNIYQNSPVIKEAISSNFRTLDSDPNITGFEITDKDENVLVEVDKSEFDDLASLSSIKIQNDDRIISEKVHVVIIRPSFDENLKWDFLYRGNKKSAKINDPEFKLRIDKGEPFAKGDVLEIDLQITQSYDSTLDAYKDKSYQVNKIYDHIKRNEQSKLDFDL